MAAVLLETLTIGKQPSTLKAAVLRALGVFASRHPAAMVERNRELISLFMEVLQSEFRKHDKVELPVIAGALLGLDGVLVHGRGDFTSNDANVRAVYSFLTLALQPPKDVARFDVPRAALRLLASHADVFSAHLTEGAEKIWELLQANCVHSNRDTRKLAFPAMERFLSQVAEQIVSGRRTVDADRVTFKFFMRRFFDMLRADMEHRHEIRMAVMGIGAFAVAASK